MYNSRRVGRGFIDRWEGIKKKYLSFPRYQCSFEVNEKNVINNNQMSKLIQQVACLFLPCLIIIYKTKKNPDQTLRFRYRFENVA